ncbi:FixJ family two-component response regulator [Phyllobacterium sp. 1468]|uniref:response regulator transcription factor n=1 Tax=Phyllobacterium sp. 1468 TaxID=2817759 RepID=UPI00285A7563|nr:response regulator transcription factor [Phyllobacterium sp. 1468]MDR6632640.1 FixJ family two-component response regulator [Phyllobacterium sp. 1468]
MLDTAKPSVTSDPTIFVIDDNEDFRVALVALLSSMNMLTKSFESARQFLAQPVHDGPGCILLDVRMPGLSGLDLQDQLERIGSRIPIIFITGHGDIPMTVRALKAGASDFIEKPFREQALLDAVTTALARSEESRKSASEVEVARALAATLTPREREVMAVVCKGLMNKQIAYALGIQEITVKIHRGNVMRKMQVRSVAELIRRSDLLTQLEPA